MFPTFDFDEERVDPWPQCIDPNMYPVPDTIDTTPLPYTTPYEPSSKWPKFNFPDDDSIPLIGGLPPAEPGSLEWFREGLAPAAESTPLDDVTSNLDFLTDMF